MLIVTALDGDCLGTASLGDLLPGVTEMPWTVCSVVGNCSSSGRDGHCMGGA